MSSNLKPIEAPALNPNYGENVKKTFENINSNFNVLANRELYKGDPGKTLLSANISWEEIFQAQDYISIGDYELVNFSNDIKSAIKKLKQTISGTVPGDDDPDIVATINGLINSGSLTVCFEEPEDSSIPTEVSNIIPFVYMDQRFRTSSFEILSDKFDMSCTIMYNGEWECVQNFPTLYYKNDEDNTGGGLYWRINGQNTLILASGPAGRDGSTGEVYIGLTNDLKLYDGDNGGTLDGNTETISITHLLIKGSPELPSGVDTSNYPFLLINDWVRYCNGNQPPTTAPIIVLSSTHIDPIVESGTVLGVPYYIASTFVASAGTGTTVTANVSKYNICYAHVTNTTIKDALMRNVKRLPANINELTSSDLPGYVIRERTGDEGYIIYAPSEGTSGSFNGGFVISYIDDVNIGPGNLPSPTFDDNKSHFHIIGNISHGYYSDEQEIEASGKGSHAEGYVVDYGTIGASGSGAHAEGHAEHQGTIEASGKGSHAEGYAVGDSTIEASGPGSHAEGYVDDENIEASGKGAHAEGSGTAAIGDFSHAMGKDSIAVGNNSFASGYQCSAGAYACIYDDHHPQYEGSVTITMSEVVYLNIIFSENHGINVGDWIYISGIDIDQEIIINGLLKCSAVSGNTVRFDFNSFDNYCVYDKIHSIYSHDVDCRQSMIINVGKINRTPPSQDWTPYKADQSISMGNQCVSLGENSSSIGKSNVTIWPNESSQGCYNLPGYIRYNNTNNIYWISSLYIHDGQNDEKTFFTIGSGTYSGQINIRNNSLVVSNKGNIYKFTSGGFVKI